MPILPRISEAPVPSVWGQASMESYFRSLDNQHYLINQTLLIAELIIAIYLLYRLCKNFSKFRKHADTPLKRLGFVLLIISLPIFFFTITKWHFVTERPMVYIAKEWKDSYSENFPKPKAVDGMDWVESKDKKRWERYDEKCLNDNKNNPKYSMQGTRIIDDCLKQIIHKVYYSKEYHVCTTVYPHSRRSECENWGFFSRDNNPYLLGLWAALSLVAAFIYSGMADKFIRWVKHGEKSR